MMAKTCVIIGASHAGVNCAFALRSHGWLGKIIVLESTPYIPYAKPPLSKTYLTDQSDTPTIKEEQAYAQQDIDLRLSSFIREIDSVHREVLMQDGTEIPFDFLVFATGAKAVIPPIDGIHAPNIFSLRTLADADKIKSAVLKKDNNNILIIGAGYVGLEIAASLRKLKKSVIVLEKEKQILSRVTSEVTSSYFYNLHTTNGVKIFCNKTVTSIFKDEKGSAVSCADGTKFRADIIIFGVGATPQTHLAEQAGLDVDGGILVDQNCRTSNPIIFGIGDCTRFKHPLYNKKIRIESIQNAVDQAKVAASNISGKPMVYDSLPWFWSDQYDVKLQMAGIPTDYTKIVTRKESGNVFSVWYLKNEFLVAVDAMNNPRAYMLGMKLIKSKSLLEPEKIGDIQIPLSATSFLK